MKIIDTNISGGNWVEHDTESLRKFPYSPLNYDKTWSILTDDAEASDEDQSPRLEISWMYKVNWGGKPIFEFGTIKYFRVHEIKIPATDEEIRNLIIKTHNHLHQEFDRKRDEYSGLFNPVTYLSEDILITLVSELRTELLALPK